MMTIGKLAAAAEVGVETIRFYQRRGLIETPTRNGGIRRYGSDDLRRLRFVRQAQAAGFTLAEIAELIETTARFCVESRRFPDELIKDVVELRKLFEATVELFDKATNPLLSRAPGGPTGFGRKASNQQFGRI